MQILFLTPNFPPEVNAAASRTFDHCRRWAAAGHRVRVICPAPNWPTGRVYPGFRNRWRSVEEIEGVEVIRIWTFLHPNSGYVGRLLSFVSFMLHAIWEALWHRRADVLAATSPQFFCGQAGMVLKLLTGVPFVLEVRDIWPESIAAVGAMKRSHAFRLIEWLEWRMYCSADHIVTVGEGYRKKLIERSASADKISVVPNGVDLDLWRDASDSLHLRKQWRGEDRYVCTYVGTVGMAHGLEVVIRAARRLQQLGRRDVVFWIVGDGAQRETLAAIAAREQLDNVVFTGQVKKQQVASVIAASDSCLVHLRDTELFATVTPSKIFEIMAMEKPIIMGVRGPALALVQEANAGLAMTPECESSLLAQIQTLRNAPDRFAQGRAFVRERFHRDKLAREMLRVLECVADKAPVTRPAEIGTADLDVAKAT